MANNMNRRNNRRPRDDDSHHSDNELLTDQQKEEEAMFKSVFNFYQMNRGGVPIERYELPMLLDACGYKLSDEKINSIQDHLDSKQV